MATIGVLALQGDVAEHLRAVESAGAHALAVRRPAELDAVDGLIVPGGESTTIWKLLEIFDLASPLRDRIKAEMPETNLVFFDTEATGMTAEAFANLLRKEGVLVSTSGKHRARACLHLDVTAALVEEALSVMKHVVNTA